MSDQKLCECCEKIVPEEKLVAECKKCGCLYCEDCQATYNQFTQIDYNCCKKCAED